MNVSIVGNMDSLYMNENPQVVLADGQKVRVAVIKNNGKGTCLVSMCGGKFNVRCERNFEAGQTFEAKVSACDGKIQIQPAEEKIFASSFVRFMENNGFVPDEIAEKVFKFMEQSGFRIDGKIIRKSRALALNFPGQEKAAAEIACMLMEKGIEPTEKIIMRILLYLENVNPDGDGNQNENEGHGDEKKDGDFKKNCVNPDDGKNSSSEKNGEKEAENQVPQILDDVYSVLPCKTGGILGFLNQYKAQGSPIHWLVLPYEWQAGEKKSFGFIKLLVNLELERTEKVLINCKIACKKYFFVLYFNHSKVKEIRFCSLPPLLSAEIKDEEKGLGELFCSGMNGNSVPVTYSDLAYSEGLYSSSEIPISFEDDA